MAAAVRRSLLSVANTTYRVPRVAAKIERRTPDGRPVASPKGVCCVCGTPLSGTGRYCDTHRRERFSEQWRKLWAEGKVKAAQGVAPVQWTGKGQPEAQRKYEKDVCAEGVGVRD